MLRILSLFALVLFVVGCATTHESSASALYNKGVVLVNKGKYEPAKQIFHEYIASYQDTHLYPISLYYLALCYQKLDNDKEAVLVYHKVIDLAPEQFWVQMAKKRIQEIEGKSL